MKNKIKIISWNVNGLKSSIENNDFIKLKKYDADIYCLQEIKTKRKYKIYEGYYHYYNISKNNNGGTLVVAKNKPKKVYYGIKNEYIDKEGRIITLEYESFFIVNVYFPNSQFNLKGKKQREYFDEIFYDYIRKISDKKIIICGDFNTILTKNDVNNNKYYKECSFEKNNLLNLFDDGFIDAYRCIHKRKKEWTFYSNRTKYKKDICGFRLDLFVLSESLKNKIIDVSCIKSIKSSDHIPICIEMRNERAHTVRPYVELTPTKESRPYELNGRARELTPTKKEHNLKKLWIEYEKYFDEYVKELNSIQFRISYLAKNKRYKEIALLQNKIIDNIKFRCLAIDSITRNWSPPGVDNVIWKTDEEKMRAALFFDRKNYKASNTRIIEIKQKYTDKKRKCGILTYNDKLMSKLLLWGFKPIEESVGDKNSFAFRLGRTRQDAICSIIKMYKNKNSPKMYVYIDVKGFYSNIQHKWIMENVPINKNIMREFLNVGHIFLSELFPASDIGISEGSPLSPTIANYVLDGLEKILGKTNMVRFADDILVATHSIKDANKIMNKVKKFLSKRGLIISEEKSKIGFINDGVDFVGFNIKKENNNIFTIRPKKSIIEKFILEMDDFITEYKKNKYFLIKEVNQKLYGFGSQYRFCDTIDDFKRIDIAIESSLLKYLINKYRNQKLNNIIKNHFYIDNLNQHWFCMKHDISNRIIHLRDTHLISIYEKDIDVNPYFNQKYFDEVKKENDIQYINGRYKSIWNKQNGKCIYCGRDILPTDDKKIIIINNDKPYNISNLGYIHSICSKNEYVVYKTYDNTDLLEEYDIYNNLKKIYDNDKENVNTTILDNKIKISYKYIKLYEYFYNNEKNKIDLTFKKIEEIIGFKLSKSLKKSKTMWYSKKDKCLIADSWNLNGYKLEKIDLINKKLYFVSLYKDKKKLEIPEKIKDKKLPKDAKYEIENFLEYIIDKYAL